ncbi:MAG: hypothetical protein KAQ66_01645 [Rhodospirillaceae bacterium]|nr:hypothetical protein [Rhodospirillaceae bacterium]
MNWITGRTKVFHAAPLMGLLLLGACAAGEETGKLSDWLPGSADEQARTPDSAQDRPSQTTATRTAGARPP